MTRAAFPLMVTTASAYSRTILLVATMERRVFDADPFAPESKVVYFNEAAAEPWGKPNEVTTNIASVTRFRYPDRDRQIQVVLCAEGHVGFFGKEEGFYEKIAGAGLHAEDARGYGYMNMIRQIGAPLYACGGGGQIYKRVAPGDWRSVDEAMLAAGRDLIFEDVNGPHEESLYLVGQRGSAYWKGKGPFQDMGLPTSVWLNRILVEDEKNVWICGDKGTLLRGNHIDGFREAAPAGGETFLSMAQFEGRIYLASATGLYVLERGRISRVRATLEPELYDAHILDAVDGVLWSIGYRDIARFDGRVWQRLDLPGNPPIR